MLSLRNLFFAVSTGLFLTLAGCDSKPTKEATDSAKQMITFSLEDTEWQLKSFMDGKAKATGKANLMMDSEKKRVAGSAGCNRYFGSYNVSGETIQFSQMGATKMMCQDMSEEDHFFKYMQRVNRFQMEANQLILFKDNQPLMQFEAQGEPKKKLNP